MKISSYTADGLSSGNTTSVTLSIRNTNGITKVAKKSTGSGRKKQLNYNPRELSSAILRAKKSLSASKVTAMAQTKLISLSKCKGTGQYDDAEVNMAIAHAKRMVQCAKIKTQNLLQEERSKKRYEEETKAEQRQQKNQAKARIARKEHDLEQKYNLEHRQWIQKQKSQKRELIRRKKNHRSQEQSKLNEADMKYLKQQLRGQREPYSASRGFLTGATLDLSAEAMQLSELQMEQQMTEAQIEQEIEQQMAVEAGMGVTSASISDGAGISDGAAVAAAATSVDISI